MLELYRAKEKSRLDQISRLHYATEQCKKLGRLEGLAESKVEAQRDLAKNLIAMKMETALIAKACNLSIETIEDMRKELELLGTSHS